MILNSTNILQITFINPGLFLGVYMYDIDVISPEISIKRFGQKHGNPLYIFVRAPVQKQYCSTMNKECSILYCFMWYM